MDSNILNSLNVEQDILGAILVFPEAMKACLDAGLEGNAFSSPLHQQLFNSFLQIYNGNKLITLEDAIQYLPSELGDIETINYLNKLIDASLSDALIDNNVRILLDKAQRRSLIAAAQNVIQQCWSEPEQDIVLDGAERSILEITKTRRGAEFKTAGQVIDEVEAELRELIQGIHPKSITTGYTDLDRLTGSFKNGELIILAARPSMGKTAFALNLAFQTSLRNSGSVAVFSLEMPGSMIMKRMIASVAKIDGQKLNDGSISEFELQKIYQADNMIRESNIKIDDTSMLTMGQIFSKCRKLKADEGKLSLIVIDYLQLIQGNSQRKENRQQEITEISRNLKMLAKEMECPVIALSQLSRKVEDRTDHEPQLSDLRESGAIEQDADMVMFLYRESYYETEENPDPVDVVDVLLKKNRNGATGKTQLAFEKQYSKFSNVAY